MPGYGLLDAAQGAGLLPWSWAVERLERSHDYWVATVDGDGRPHVMPVWGVWTDDALWFSSSRGSRKARNLAANAHCAITTDNAYEPVVIEGEAALIDGPAAIGTFVAEIKPEVRDGLFDRLLQSHRQRLLSGSADLGFWTHRGRLHRHTHPLDVCAVR
jgi:hypothetical protein